jgi:hypothetical protein
MTTEQQGQRTLVHATISFFVWTVILWAILALSGCATAARPFVTSYPASLTVDPRDPFQQMYFSRPRPVTVAATIHNPTSHDAVVTVFCYGNIFEGKSTRDVMVKAGAESRFLVEVMSSDAFEPCQIQFFHFIGLPGPDADL